MSEPTDIEKMLAKWRKPSQPAPQLEVASPFDEAFQPEQTPQTYGESDAYEAAYGIELY